MLVRHHGVAAGVYFFGSAMANFASALVCVASVVRVSFNSSQVWVVSSLTRVHRCKVICASCYVL